MRILIIHNRYKFESGEEAVVLAESELLRRNGHQVISFELSNYLLDKLNIFQKISLPFRCMWSVSSYEEVRQVIKKEKPDLAHIHNTFFLISPSVYYACRKEGVPVVQTLHNYRFICPLATLYRDGLVCRECQDKGLIMSLRHKCGEKSMMWTAAMCSTLKFHHIKGTFKSLIDTYIALSNFSRERFIEAGYDPEKIKIKPNFINFDPGVASKRGNFALYVGRCSPEKGVDALMEAWKQVDHLPLKIIGSGDQFNEYRDYALRYNLNIEFLGQKANSEVINHIKDSLFVIMPSKCNENFPRTIVEAFACEVPVLASKRGALTEIVEDNKTGLLFEPEDIPDLLKKVRLLCENRDLAIAMGQNARKEFEAKYTAEKNYKILMDIYEGTLSKI